MMDADAQREVWAHAGRMRRATNSCTVTFETDDGARLTRVGYGRTLAERYLAAVDQLPSGEYTCLCVSTPGSVYGSLVGHAPVATTSQESPQTRPFAQYEGKRVCRS